MEFFTVALSEVRYKVEDGRCCYFTEIRQSWRNILNYGKGLQNMLLKFDIETLCLRSSACIQEAETFEGSILRVEERTDGRG